SRQHHSSSSATDGAKKANERNSIRKQQQPSSSAKGKNVEGASSSAGNAAESKRIEKLSTKDNTTNNNNIPGKKKGATTGNNNSKEPTTRASSSSSSAKGHDADTDSSSTVSSDATATNAKRTPKSRGAAAQSSSSVTPSTPPSGSASPKKGQHVNNSREKSNKPTGARQPKETNNTANTPAVRPSSITSSCSFLTSSSSLSPTSPTSPASFSSSPSSPLTTTASSHFAAGESEAHTRREGSPFKQSAAADVTHIKTSVARESSTVSASAGSAVHSPLSASSPSSRRSSALNPLADKFGFGRLGGLPTVEETVSEKKGYPESHGISTNQAPPAGSAKRGHSRSLSMKEQLAQLGQESGKEGTPKTLESLQEIISSLKSLPTAHGVAGNETVGTSRHEKRLSMSSLPSRNSIGPVSGGSSTTTLHISQPPRGTNIETALQSTVATLRRLSLSDQKRPVLNFNKEDDFTESTAHTENTNNRRSVAFSTRDLPSTSEETLEGRRNRRSAMMGGASSESTYTAPSESTSSAFKPNRRSVVISQQEVDALREGRTYVPPTFGFASDDEEPDSVADALSALEGKGSLSNRSSLAAKGPSQRSGTSVDPNSLAEFAANLPSHMRGAAALVNNDDALDRRRYTTAFGLGANRASALPNAGASGTANKRLSTAPSTRESDRKDWRNSTPVASHGSNRDSIMLKDSGNGRRPLFMAHLTYSDFHSLLTKQKHKYVQGVLRINKRNRSDAYVTVDTLPEGDVYICGSKDRNRALEGDVVGIELIDPEELPLQKLEGNKDKKKSKRTEEIGDAAEAEVDEVKPKYCGRVVSIVERSLSQMFSGTLTLQRPSGSSKKNDRKKQDEDDGKGQPRIVWFKPTDKRVPLIAIPIDQAPADFVENHASYVHKLFVATVKRWPLSSLHPFGHLERELGDIGNIEIETEALLADNNVTTTAFGEKVEKCLPDLPWVIPEKELSRRRDLREECVFTIDPATAKDLDDAVSCTRHEDGTYEIGVHIADVSHFIKVGSALDREAKSRATTVYLVQKAIPMLPNVLCEDLCSLTANVDRLAFSVFWKMTEDGHVMNTSFSKSVIRSCAQLSYDDAQRVITTGSLDPKVEVFGQPRTLVEDNIKVFFKLSQILRQKRFENGALSINSIKLNFETDEIFNPLDVSVYELKESNRLIEEFMLLANMSVAKQIFEFFPEQALLRRHEQPLEKRMVDFISHMNKIGLDLDASSSGALQQSLDAIQDPDVRKVVRLLVIKPMQRAKYICTGMLSPEKYHHYALNAPLYTHFTSPIRRYADIIVHRMLEASLTGDSKFYLGKESCQKSANHCNIKKDAAKLAQEQSSHVYLSVLLHNMTESKGMVVRDAIVVQVLDAAFDVLVPEYGLEKRVYVDQLPLERHAWNEKSETLRLYWGTAAFKAPEEEEEPENKAGGTNSRRTSMMPAAHIVDSMDHPDDATNAYDDERGLFDDESDYEDEDSHSGSGDHGNDDDEEDADVLDDEVRRLTRIRIFGHVQVLITADTTVSPPVIKVIAMNPYASADTPNTGAFAPGIEA
ncbi:hypothetical protein BGZ83_003393, partial [Gryganskiella cystojenkinii]